MRIVLLHLPRQPWIPQRGRNTAPSTPISKQYVCTLLLREVTSAELTTQLLPDLPPSKSFADYGTAATARTFFDEHFAELLAKGVVKPVDWSGVEKKEIHIPTRDGSEIRAVVYRPENVQPGPLCVYFHGGGWTIGKPELWEGGAEVLTKQLGVTVVDVAYRLAPEHPFPTAANDACDALRWCAENPRTLGVDVSKGLLVAGTSAGGNLAAVAAHDAVEKKIGVTGVVLMSASLVHSEAVPEKYKEHYKSRETHKDAMVLDTRGMEWFWGEFCGLLAMKCC